MKRLKFTKSLCIGCGLCGQMCSANKEDSVWPEKARIFIETSYDDGKLVYHDHYCTLCGICVKSCPENAITLNEYLQVDAELCTGCGICAEKCPKKVIRIREDFAVICDTCEGDPTCVQVCPQNALRFE
ncbi:MAG: 4Fe-4S binding protein [Anaerovoracaceae bacterium]|nr:4Fe-4S binding protein [Anaerovoracaceae bacterium]